MWVSEVPMLSRIAGVQGTVRHDWKFQKKVDETHALVDAKSASVRQPPNEPAYDATEIIEPGSLEVDELPADEEQRRLFVPVLGAIAAGLGVETIEAGQFPTGAAQSYVQYDKGAPPGSFAVRVQGDSMEPDYCHGDVAVVDPARRVESGLACVLSRDSSGERTARLKRVKRKGKDCRLESLNPAYSPIIMKAADLLAAYKVVEVLPRLRRQTRK